VGGADVSREGVQRDLLPIIEGTTVATKHGPVKSDHILFIASGAFHFSKPSDLLPELQGRLPIRVELKALTRDDFARILREPENSLVKQYKALLATEQVTLDFAEDGIDAIADTAADINHAIENIGARRLHTVIEKVLEEISFAATDKSGTTLTIDPAIDAWLRDHAVDGVPYLPGVHGVALFEDASWGAALEDVRFEYPVKFLRDRARTLRVERADDSLSLSSEGVGARVHFRARVASALPQPPHATHAPTVHGAAEAAAIYGRFFHGPAA